MFQRRLLSALSALFVISTSFTTYADDQVKTGYFIDAPVTGLYYKTSSNLSGYTDKGKFDYKPGDVVSFFLGKNDQGYQLTSVSAQQVVTPSLASATPSRSINMVRLLLSLDADPENQMEIVLDNELLSNPEFHAMLKATDLNAIEEIYETFKLASHTPQEALTHLNNSQTYIEENFASEEILFEPLEVPLRNLVIKKKDNQGRVCLFDLRYAKHPRYAPPIGETRYTIHKETVTEHPSIGDYFDHCQLSRGREIKEDIEHVIDESIQNDGLVACSQTGCTRNDLNDFDVEDFDDEGDWKYRSIAKSFDPQTKLHMEKMQGLGEHEEIVHLNKVEWLMFTYPDKLHQQIPYEGIWKQTDYSGSSLTERCLLISQGTVMQAPADNGVCPQKPSAYHTDVTQDYGDMWWISDKSEYASLGQMNLMVRWYLQNTRQPKHTSWEYLPAGKHWDQGILYRYQQNIERGPHEDHVATYAISEFTKISTGS